MNFSNGKTHATNRIERNRKTVSRGPSLAFCLTLMTAAVIGLGGVGTASAAGATVWKVGKKIESCQRGSWTGYRERCRYSQTYFKKSDRTCRAGIGASTVAKILLKGETKNVQKYYLRCFKKYISPTYYR